MGNITGILKLTIFSIFLSFFFLWDFGPMSGSVLGSGDRKWGTSVCPEQDKCHLSGCSPWIPSAWLSYAYSFSDSSFLSRGCGWGQGDSQQQTLVSGPCDRQADLWLIP